MTERAAFEIAVGAILTQNTAWTNVEKALVNLKRAKKLSVQGILTSSTRTLAQLIRPSGYFRQKAKKLKAFAVWLDSRGGSLLRWSKGARVGARTGESALGALRDELLGVHGIGPETADCILLYACGKPSFVIDAYTKRLCASFGVRFRTYSEYQRFFVRALPKSVRVYQEFHALIVMWGKARRTKKPFR